MIRVSFIGDVMCEYTRLETYHRPEGEYDFSPLFSDVKDDFAKSDLVVANLETPMAGEALRYSWRDYQFNTPEQLGVAMRDAGIAVVSTANNHVLDRGFEGLEKTLETLDAIGLRHTGSARSEEESRPLVAEIRGMRIGLLSYTYGTEACYNGYYLKPGEEYRVNLLRNQELTNPVRRCFFVSKRWLPRALRAVYRRVLPKQARRPVGELKEKDARQKARLLEDIRYARAHSDYVIMCLHCGGQFNDAPTEYTRAVVAFCLKNGVDAVVGNHEHRIQGSRLEDKDHPVAYCLGNFTSNYGIDRKPYDKNAECSILLNLYLDEETKRVQDVGFAVLVSVKGEDGVIRTQPLYDRICSAGERERRELCEKNQKAVNAFLGTERRDVAPQKEYFVSQVTGRMRE